MARMVPSVGRSVGRLTSIHGRNEIYLTTLVVSLSVINPPTDLLRLIIVSQVNLIEGVVQTFVPRFGSI